MDFTSDTSKAKVLQSTRHPRWSRCGVVLLHFLLWASSATSHPVLTNDLSGTWGFVPASGIATTIQVPGGGWYKQGFTNVSAADYTNTINIPSIGQPQVTKLQFGAINYQADLYLNNTFIASTTQAYTPATFDLTDHVVPGNTYFVRIHVKGMEALKYNGRSLVPNAAGSWCPNLPQGIFRSADLLVYPQVYIEDVFIKTSVANTNLTYEVWVRNASSEAANVTLSGSLSSWNGDDWNYPAIPAQSRSFPAHSTTKLTVGPIPWGLGLESYWWPNVPYRSGYAAKLHRLNLTLGGDTSHQTSVRFGFRECVQKSDGHGNTCYFLNGIRVNFRGDNLQGANYDGINYGGGKGDAYGTYPGFLPGPNGWPKAVDNYQRLNYNVVRIHQEPATPYMLNVCDEKGLMIINETGIRGAGDQQDFINGKTNMVNHVKALFARDRNHPAVVRVSISNEPDHSPTDSIQFQEDLYAAAMAVDGTRPVSIDAAWYDFHPGSQYGGLSYSNFSVFRHYGQGSAFGQYTDEAHARSDRPFGQGEFIWPADNTRQGFAWFATAVQAMRAKGASDVRPYTLLSAWASVIPGVATSDMQIENPPWNPTLLFPLYGENNLPNPWSNPQIQRVQAGFNPVLVADRDYWELNKLSNNNGDWPANLGFLGPTQEITRTLTIYNDTFSGSEVDVFWELRQGSATGPLLASDALHVIVPLGYTQTKDIVFTTPDVPNGTALYLVLYAEKAGVELFRETSQKFLVLRQTKLSGTAFGSTPSYSPGTEYEKASDGDQSTYFDYALANGGYTGIDLGSGNAKRISSIVFSPRAGFESRMLGGEFQGSANGTSYTTFYRVLSTPSPKTSVLINTYQPYRFLRYRGTNGSYCNIAEMTFFTSEATPLTGSAFGASPAYAAGSEFDKASDGDTSTYYDCASANNGYTGIDLGATNSQRIGHIVFTPRAGFDWRMPGGEFLGSQDGNLYTSVYIIPTTPEIWPNNTTVFVNSPIAYRYLKYAGPVDSYCNIAEMAFYAASSAPTIVATNPPTMAYALGSGELTLSWPPEHKGWQLQVQTNGLNPDGWYTVYGSSATNLVELLLNYDVPGSTFYRLATP